MKLLFKPIAVENSIILDGYTKREGYLGPIRKDGNVVYYDPKNGKYYNPRTREYT